MKKLLWILGIVGLLAGFVWRVETRDLRYLRYSLTIDIDTPSGVRSGTSVIATKFSIGRSSFPQAIGLYETTGEAVFVDLGAGEGGRPLHAIAILSGGAKGDWADWHRYLLFNVFRIGQGMSNSVVFSDLPTFKGKVMIDASSSDELKKYLPTIVTFTDINDPTTAKVIYATDYRRQCRQPREGECPNGVYDTIPVPIDRIAETFGPGHAFRRATVEIVPNDTPVTRGIEGRLPLLVTHREKLRRMIRDLPPRYQPGFSQFIREGF